MDLKSSAVVNFQDPEKQLHPCAVHRVPRLTLHACIFVSAELYPCSSCLHHHSHFHFSEFRTFALSRFLIWGRARSSFISLSGLVFLAQCLQDHSCCWIRWDLHCKAWTIPCHGYISQVLYQFIQRCFYISARVKNATVDIGVEPCLFVWGWSLLLPPLWWPRTSGLGVLLALSSTSPQECCDYWCMSLTACAFCMILGNQNQFPLLPSLAIHFIYTQMNNAIDSFIQWIDIQF